MAKCYCYWCNQAVKVGDHDRHAGQRVAFSKDGMIGAPFFLNRQDGKLQRRRGKKAEASRNVAMGFLGLLLPWQASPFPTASTSARC